MAEATTAEALQAEKLERARKANEERNSARLDRLSSIADNNDAHGADEMRDKDGNKLVMDDHSEEQREAAAAKEELDAQRYLAEQEAKALQEQGGGEEAPTKAAEAAETSEEEKPTEAQAAQDVKVVGGVTHYLTIVNGKEKWLTIDQLRTAAQKVESADEYLAAAAASVRNSARLALSPEKDEPGKVEEVDLEKTLSSAVMGDEEAIKKLASVVKELKEAQAKPSAVTPDVLQQFDERWSFRRAVEWFEDQYQDILGDPNLKKLVYERDAELFKESPTLPYKQRLKTAGDEIRGWIQKKSAPVVVKAAASETKLERKKTLVNVPSAAARQTPVEDEEAEESVEDAIQKMAKARGQSRAVVHGRTNQR